MGEGPHRRYHGRPLTSPPPAPAAAGDRRGAAPSGTPRRTGRGGLDEATASALVAACEHAWAAIRRHHPDLPPAVMVLGSGVERGRLVKLGHWWDGRWVADGQQRGEVLLAGEALHLPPAEVFEVLLHEAAHGLNAAHGVRDTSRGGRYHNQRFRDTAEALGLVVRAAAPYGLARTTLGDRARERYATAIDALSDAMRIARQLGRDVTVGAGGEGTGAGPGGGRDGGGGERTSGRSVAAVCACGRRLRIAPGTLAAAPIVCGRCGAEFVEGRQAVAGHAVVDRSFVDRRRAAMEAENGVAQVDAPVTLERRHARLAAALRYAEQIGVPRHAVEPLVRREARMASVLGSAVRAATGPGVTGRQEEGLRRLAPGVAHEDREVVARWYERFGTPDETPMPATDHREARRRTRVARALLQADGTLQGPRLHVHGTEWMAGDRLVAVDDNDEPDVPYGALGTVRRVDAVGQEADVDFATIGRLRVSAVERLAAILRHDYVEVAPVEAAVGEHEVELQRSLLELQP